MNRKMVAGLVGIISLLALVMGTVIYLKNKDRLSDKIVVSNWNGMQERYVICYTKLKGKAETNFGECWTSFSTNIEKERMIETNKEDYIGEIIFHDTSIELPASLFFSNDNYYVMWYDEDYECYSIRNCYSEYELSNQLIYVPTPAYLVLDYGAFEVYSDIGKNMLDFLYDNYTFSEAVEFYERLSGEYVKIDNENEQITVSGYVVKAHEIIADCVIFDFKNRTIIGLDENNNYITYDGTEKEPIVE